MERIFKKPALKCIAKKYCPKKGFTLAEVLITLAIIGVVAAITIPSVIVNTNQMEFKTGLRKAVSVLNQAITLNKALTGESPYDNSDLYNYLQQNMSVMRNNLEISVDADNGGDDYSNRAFYTTDGMRYEIPVIYGTINNALRLHGSNIALNSGGVTDCADGVSSGAIRRCHCGSYGLTHNPDNTTNVPCLILVDVNGDRKPNPLSVNSSKESTYSDSNGTNWNIVYFKKDERYGYTYTYPEPADRLLKDVFLIMITDQGAIPYGVVAQKAMYQAQK